MIGDRDFASGALIDLLGLLRSVGEGELVALLGTAPRLRSELVLWTRLTGHGLVEMDERPKGAVRYVIRKGVAPPDPESEAGPGERLWIYTNYHCNLACDYCCVRSSPSAVPRALPPETVRRLAGEARALGFRRIFITGGEPFIAPHIREILEACTEHLPTTVLTNGILLSGARGNILEALPVDRLVLQVSVDSPTPELHDRHRGAGSWERAWGGVDRARRLGFRVRIAATVRDAAEGARMDAWLAERGFRPEDRTVRPVARRGAATEGVTLTRSDLVPEVTVSDRGVSWHPVGADDDDFLVVRGIPPLGEALATIQRMWDEERATSAALAEVFRCA